MSGATRNVGDYAVPEGVLGLKGPVDKPAPGTLPLRGDLAHMALVGTHLAAHYVIPHVHAVGASGAGLRLTPRGDAEVFAELPAGSRFELLDVAGEWVWGCPGPQGPSGWCRASDLAASEARAVATRLFIDGAAGTTGLEIRERLQGRGEFDLIVLDDAQRKDEAARRDALHAADIAILCLPDEAAKEAVKLAEGSGTRIIDASSAHRVAEGWTYGFPELIGHEVIANARLVSNPGCYPTGFLALVAPLVRAGLLPADWPYTVNAVSGYSGGGNALIERFEAEPDIAFRAYGLAGGHKHLPEMQTYAGLAHAPVFSPSVISAHRGMVVDVPLPLAALPGQPQGEAIHAALEAFYAGSPFVAVAPLAPVPGELLLLKSAVPWDGLSLHVCPSADGTQARLIARLDNLGKGASGAAIQNLNIMCGLPETTGLRL